MKKLYAIEVRQTTWAIENIYAVNDENALRLAHKIKVEDLTSNDSSTVMEAKVLDSVELDSEEKPKRKFEIEKSSDRLRNTNGKYFLFAKESNKVEKLFQVRVSLSRKCIVRVIADNSTIAKKSAKNLVRRLIKEGNGYWQDLVPNVSLVEKKLERYYSVTGKALSKPLTIRSNSQDQAKVIVKNYLIKNEEYSNELLVANEIAPSEQIDFDGWSSEMVLIKGDKIQVHMMEENKFYAINTTMNGLRDYFIFKRDGNIVMGTYIDIVLEESKPHSFKVIASDMFEESLQRGRFQYEVFNIEHFSNTTLGTLCEDKLELYQNHMSISNNDLHQYYFVIESSNPITDISSDQLLLELNIISKKANFTANNHKDQKTEPKVLHKEKDKHER